MGLFHSKMNNKSNLQELQNEYTKYYVNSDNTETDDTNINLNYNRNRNKVKEVKEYNNQEIKKQLKQIVDYLRKKGEITNNDEQYKNIRNIHQTIKSKSIKDIENDLEGIVRVYAILMDFNLLNPIQESEKKSVSGTAFFISPIYLVSCYHVVKDAVKIEIKINDRRYDVKIISFCEILDIVLLKVYNYRSKHYFELDNSDTIKMNDIIYTYGYPLGSETLKITAGIISGFQDDKIQIDAPINPGNSGGPLFNDKGKIIGINTSIILYANNIGFSTQINTFKNLFLYDTDISRYEGICKYLDKYIVPKYFHFEVIPVPKEIYELNPDLNGGVLVTKVIDLNKIQLSNSKNYYSQLKRGIINKYSKNDEFEVLKQIYEKNKTIQVGDIITRVEDYDINRLGMCYKKTNENRKIPFNSVCNSYKQNILSLDIYKYRDTNKYEYREMTTLQYGILDITNMMSIRYRYDTIIDRETDNCIVLDGIIIQELNLNHINYIYQNKNNFVHLIKYLDIDKWNENVLFISHINEESEKSLCEDIIVGDVLTHINDIKVKSLRQCRRCIEDINKSDDKIFTFKTENTMIYFKNNN